jgi:hypothetical protein
MDDLVAGWVQNTHRKFHRMVAFVGAVCREIVSDLRNWQKFRNYLHGSFIKQSASARKT